MNVTLLAAGHSVHTVRWANGLAACGHEVHLVTLHEVSPDLDGAVHVHRLPSRGRWKYFSNVPALKKVLRQNRPDILHAHYASGYGTLARLVDHHPYMLSVWGSDVYEVPLRSWIHRRIIIANLRDADWVCSTSEAMARHVESLCERLPHVSITPFGVDVSQFKPPAKDSKRECVTIGTVKSLRQIYGIDNLIRGFARCLQSLRDAGSQYADRLRLLIVGDGPLRSELEALTRELGVSEVTTFAGAVNHSDVPEWLGKLDIYVAMSRRESFGVAVVEASACGVPVVVSNVGGLPEVVEDERSGFIVERDDVEQLGCRLVRLVTDTALRRQMGDAGRNFVKQKYQWSECLQRMLDVYERFQEHRNHKRVSA